MIKLISIITICVTAYATQIIEISKQQQNDLGVTTSYVKKAINTSFGPYNGVVVLDKKDIISISSNIDSMIENIHVSKLEHVKKGQKLLTLKSHALLNLQREYIQALIQGANVNKNYERNLKLQSEGIISSKRLLESQNQKQSSDFKVQLTGQQLLTSGFSKEMLKILKSTHEPILEKTITAPKEAVVSQIDVNIGEYIQSDHGMMTIYADGKRFVEVSVPVNSVEQISVGDKCIFSKYNAKVSMIGNIVNTSSQSVQLRAEIQNGSDIFINRIYEVKILKDIKGAFIVKKSSLVFEGKNSYIFKKVSNGFEVVKAEIISEESDSYVVKADLKVSDSLALTSTSALLSAMEE